MSENDDINDDNVDKNTDSSNSKITNTKENIEELSTDSNLNEINEEENDYVTKVSINDSPDFINSVKYGFKGIFQKSSVWFIVLPIVTIIFSLIYLASTLGISALIGTMAYNKGEGGLHSGNPTPFILLALTIIILGTIILPVSSSIIELSKVKHVSNGLVISASESLSYSKGVFSKVYVSALISQLITLILYVPIALLNLGEQMVSTETNGTLLGFTIVVFFLMIVLSPYLTYSVTLMADKALGNTLLPDTIKPTSAIFKVSEIMNFKKNYFKLILIEVGLAFIVAILSLTVIGIIFAIPATILTRAYIYKTIVNKYYINNN